MPDNYIEIMIQSLEKKSRVLDEILKLSRDQKNWLEDPDLTPETFEENVGKKAELIDQLDALDEGFETLYERVSGQLNADRGRYAKEIRTMQKLIAEITEKSVEIQAVEARNKSQVEARFSTIRKQIRQVKDNQKVVKEYYRNMQKMNYVEPQFMDNKK